MGMGLRRWSSGQELRAACELHGDGGTASRRRFAPKAMFLGVLFFLAHLTHGGDAEEASVQQPLRMPKGTISSLRSKRSADHVISDCIMVTSEEGEYFYKAPQASVGEDGSGEYPPVCGVYFLTDPSRRVELSLHYLRVPCAAGGLVSFMDGWELNGELFPTIEDHPLPLKDRFEEFCSGNTGGVVINGGRGSGLQAASKKRKKERLSSSAMGSLLTLISAQNAALVQYRMPPSVRGIKGRTPDVYGFSFSVRFVRNPTPCNILVEDTSNVYTLRNYGRAVNCSLATLFPARLRVLSLSVGSTPGGVTGAATNSIHQSNAIKRNMEVETGTIHRCEKRGMPDYVEVGGAPGLDITNLAVSDSICGMDSRPGSTVETILCGVSTVRMVSSGWFDNAVTIALRQAADQDVAEATLVCPAAMEIPEDLGELAAELGEAGLEGFSA